MNDRVSYSLRSPGLKSEFIRRLGKVTDISAIRLQKLLEISQALVIYLLLGIVVGNWMDRLFPKYVPTESKSYTLKWTIFQACVIAIAVFYIQKLVEMIPFLFQFSSGYVTSLKGESRFGGGIALSMVMIATQPNFTARIASMMKIV